MTNDSKQPDSDRPQSIDIARRLRQTRANMLGTDDEAHYWDCHEAAAEIDRLRLTQAEIDAITAAMVTVDADTVTLRNLLLRHTGTCPPSR